MKYLRVNLTKGMRDRRHMHPALRHRSTWDLNTRRHTSCARIGRLTVVHVSVFSSVTSRLNTTSVRVWAGTWWELTNGFWSVRGNIEVRRRARLTLKKFLPDRPLGSVRRTHLSADSAERACCVHPAHAFRWLSAELPVREASVRTALGQLEI